MGLVGAIFREWRFFMHEQGNCHLLLDGKLLFAVCGMKRQVEHAGGVNTLGRVGNEVARVLKLKKVTRIDPHLPQSVLNKDV
eukprot:scaffold41421_cov150-Skeletonema_dohrnii-CCMP3373.AAC.2